MVCNMYICAGSIVTDDGSGEGTLKLVGKQRGCVPASSADAR